MICWKCKKNIEITKINRADECPFCHVDLHCCKNCKFYSVGSHFDCKENIEDLVTDKEKSSFCDFFELKTDQAVSETKKTDALNKAQALFGEAVNITNNDSDAAKSAFNSLFNN